MSFDAKRIYELLPAIYRVRDAEQGGQLQALISILSEQADVVQDNLAQMYDDLFIETCADWVVPYVGDLIGHTPIYGVTAKISSPRAEVANTIGYRRRKGTVAVLGQLAHDVTGWPSRVVEFFQLLATTQHLNHLRPLNLQSPDLRDWEVAQYLDTAFDTVAHTAEMRRIATRKGRYNIPNIGIFVWRLRPYSVTRGSARLIVPDGYTFDPMGMDIPLFNPSRSEELSHLAQPINVPGPLQRRPLYREVEALRASGTPPAPVWFADPPVLAVYKNGTPIPANETMICDLNQWTLPPAVKFYEGVGMPIQVAVDPVLGRLTFPANTTSPEDAIEVDFDYGFSGDYGCGEYARPDLPPPSATVTQIDSSRTIAGPQNITVAADETLATQAADGKRPVLDGLVTVSVAPNSALTLDGLLLGQGIVITGQGPFTLTLKRCTIRPQAGIEPVAISWQASGGGLLLLDHTLSGAIVSDTGVALEVRHSLIDAAADATFAVAARSAGDAAGEITLVCSTVIGQISVRETVLVENSIVTGTMTSQRTQSGCVRFSYLRLDSIVPRRYECQPNLAADAAVANALKDNPSLTLAEQEEIADRVAMRVRPAFTALQYGNPAYAQLDRSCPQEITHGAEDRSEMGVFHDLFQPWRESNLLFRLNEYLRIGLEAGILYVN